MIVCKLKTVLTDVQNYKVQACDNTSIDGWSIYCI